MPISGPGQPPADGAPLPVVFVNHGGGPMPLLGQQPTVATFLRAYGAKFRERPRAVLVVTAHWEEPCITVSSGRRPSLYFDYGGFPKESYEYTYPAPAAPDVAQEAVELLKGAGIPVKTDESRGWDHGVFVPMMLMFPDADVPIVQMSLRRDQDARHHLAVGRALEPLRHKKVLIVASGVSFHNFQYFFARDPRMKEAGRKHSQDFDGWLQGVLADPEAEPEARLKSLEAWEQAPSARECHPRGAAEHFVPLLVAAGAAGGGPATAVGASDATKGELDGLMDFAISNFEWR